MFGVATTIPANIPTPVASTDYENAIVDESTIEDEDVSKYRLSWSPFRIFLAGLLVIGAPMTVFLYCGGMRWAKRVFRGRGPEKGRYKLVGDEDLEK